MVFRRRTVRPRRRLVRRRRVPRAVKAYVSRKVRQVNQVKEYRTGGTHNLSSTVVANAIASSSLSYILKGDELFQREGNAVYLKRVQVRWNAENNSALQSRMVRILIVKENFLNTGTVSGTTIFQDQDFADFATSGLQNRLAYPINTRLWQVIADRKFTIPAKTASTNAIRTGFFSIPIRRRVIYYPTSASTTDTSTGHYYLVTLVGDTSTTTDQLEFNFMARVWFTDCSSFRRH